MTPDAELVVAFVEKFGVPVFPCKPGKKEPATKHGFLAASNNISQIREWSNKSSKLNWAMPTGTMSGFIIIDVDVRPDENKRGDETLQALEAKYGKLPDTATVLTPQHGLHYWFRTNGTKLKSGTDKFGNGVDLKAEGGYVLIPPSVFKERAYEWEASSDPAEVGFADTPKWVVDLAADKRDPGRLIVTSGADVLLESVAAGTALHDSLRDLAAHYAALGLGFTETCKILEFAMDASKAPRDQRWQERFDSIPKLVNSAIEKFAPNANRDLEPWTTLNLEKLAKREPEAPKFIIDDWLPCGYATLLAGHGGIGKSAIALMLAVCVALGIPFFGLQVIRRRVLILSCEDRASVLHWRLWRISKYFGIDLASLHGWLEIIDLVGRDCVLWERDPRTGYTVTPAYTMLEQHTRQYQTEVLVADGISDTFGGNENARTEVKRFINSLVSLIPSESGAVLVVGHIAKPTAAGNQTSEGYSGSTGWHNSVRARWYLYPETTQGDDGERAERTGNLILELQKSNMGRIDQFFQFAWDEDAHLFVGTRPAGETHFDRKVRDGEEQAGILRALAGCGAAGIIVPAAMQGPRTAYHVLSLRPEFPETLRSGRAGKLRFRRQIEELRQLRAIKESEYRRTNRHPGARWEITPEGMRQCAK